ncbi:MAG: DoxX family protein [Alphaproteobacteria bacterium]|nr:DoxX family protein [Alphaproteobacteria bacterium]
MSDTPKLFIPQFGPIYRAFAPATEPLIRVAVGLSLAAHGYPKLFTNPAGNAAFFEQAGFSPGMFWAILVGLTETVGGIFLAAGFLTRAVSVPILIFLLTAIHYHTQFGFYWNARGIEYPLVLSLVVLHYLVRGGGPWSVDAKLGREF